MDEKIDTLPKKELKVKEKPKKIYVDFFQVKERVYEDGKLVKNNIYSLRPILENAYNIGIKERTWKYNGDTARLQIVKKVSKDKKFDNLKDCDNLWEVQFVRISKDLLPGIATDEGEYDPKLLSELLKDNQGIAESVSIIYDDKLCVLAVQRNNKGILPSGILDFFQEITKDKNIAFDAINLDIDLTKLKKDNIYRNIEIGFADLKRNTVINTKVKQLNNIINSLKQYESASAKIVLSMGHSSRKNSLEPELSVDTIMNLNKSPYINTLRIKTSENGDKDIETIDLVEERLKDDFTIKFSKVNPITHENVILGLLGSYSKNKDKLENKLIIE